MSNLFGENTAVRIITMLVYPERSHAMGDKGGKKDKDKRQKQKVTKQKQETQKKQGKQQKST
jgi:hypothetical protein